MRRQCQFEGCITLLARDHSGDYCSLHDSEYKRALALERMRGPAPAPVIEMPQRIAVKKPKHKTYDICDGCGGRKYIPGDRCTKCKQQEYKDRNNKKKTQWKNPPCTRCGGPTFQVAHLGYLRCMQKRGPCGCFVAPVRHNGETLKQSWEGSRFNLQGEPMRPYIPANWRVIAWVKPKKVGAGDERRRGTPTERPAPASLSRTN